MSRNNYRIVLNGEVVPGADPDSVKEKMAGLFNLSASQVETLFSGKRQVVKKDIDQKTAERYKAAIENTGAVCLVEISEVDISGLSLADQPAAENEPVVPAVCPKCGYQALSASDPLVIAHDGLGECPACGIIVSKYLAEHPPTEEEKTEEEADRVPGVISDEHVID